MLPLFDDYLVEVIVLSTLALRFGKSLLGERLHHATAIVDQFRSGAGDGVFSSGKIRKTFSLERVVRLKVPNLLAKTIVTATV